jgi:hypothetical protein
MPSTSSTSKCRRGAPPGNQNARKHGLYSVPNLALSHSEENPLALDLGSEIGLIRQSMQCVLALGEPHTYRGAVDYLRAPILASTLKLATTDKPQMRALKTKTHSLNSKFKFSQFEIQLFLFVFFETIQFRSAPQDLNASLPSAARMVANRWFYQVNINNGAALARDGAGTHYFYTVISDFGRYCSASARWAGPICSAPARSAMLRASFKVR